jgi:hypothetical protein
MSRLTRHRSRVTYVVNLDTLSSTLYFTWSGPKRIGVISALCLALTGRGGQGGGRAGLLVRLEKIIHRLRATS